MRTDPKSYPSAAALPLQANTYLMPRDLSSLHSTQATLKNRKTRSSLLKLKNKFRDSVSRNGEQEKIPELACSSTPDLAEQNTANYTCRFLSPMIYPDDGMAQRAVIHELQLDPVNHMQEIEDDSRLSG